MDLINLTRHPIHIYTDTGISTILPSTPTPRVREDISSNNVYIDTDYGRIQVISKELMNIVGMPPLREDTMYIVSLVCAQAYPDRNDLLVVGEVVKDNRKQVLYAMSLAYPRGKV